jgi:hypothetical protein
MLNNSIIFLKEKIKKLNESSSEFWVNPNCNFLKCQHQYSFQKTFSEPKRDEKIAAVIFLKQLPSPYSKIRVIVKNKPFFFHLLHKYVFFFLALRKNSH